MFTDQDVVEEFAEKIVDRNKEVAMDQSHTPQNSSPQHVPEKYLIAFVIQGDDVFKITADNIIHTTGTADGPAFDAIAKLKAAAALLELTNRHKERPDELKKMARELAGEGMKLMARASSSIRAVAPPEEAPEEVDSTPAPRPVVEPKLAEMPGSTEAKPAIPPAFGPRAVASTPAAVPEVAARAQVPASAPAPVPVPVSRTEERSGASGTIPIGSRIALIST